MIRAAGSRTPLCLRNRAIVTVLWRAGLRVGELVALLPKDLDLYTGRLDVLHGKGDKRRTLAIDPEACDVVARWAAARHKTRYKLHSPLFCTWNGAPLNKRYVRSLLQRLADKAGITKRVHPHGLRHTCAAEWASEGMPLPLIQAALGHANIRTTSIYVAHFGAPEVIAALRARKGWTTPEDRDHDPNARRET